MNLLNEYIDAVVCQQARQNCSLTLRLACSKDHHPLLEVNAWWLQQLKREQVYSHKAVCKQAICHMTWWEDWVACV